MRAPMIIMGRKHILIGLGFLSLIVASCAGVNTQSVVETAIAQTQEISQLQTAAAGANISETPTAQGQNEPLPTEVTATPPPPSTQAPVWDWNGVWNIREASSLFKGTLTINGNFITGVLDCAWDGCLEQLTIHGTLSEGGQIASGTVEAASGGEGPFQWQITAENPNQFVGNYTNGTGQFCGWRDGAAETSPCLWP